MNARILTSEEIALVRAEIIDAKWWLGGLREQIDALCNMALSASSGQENATRQLRELCEHIDGFFISGNDVPVTRHWLHADSWKITKELIEEGLPLSHDLIEREAVYRKKKTAYGDETRAQSPLEELRQEQKE